MTAIVPFSFQGAEIRTLTIDGEPWWVATDVAAVLEFRMASDATRSLDDDEKGYAEVRTPGGPQRVAIINEPGLYRMIFRSKSADAKLFQRWVIHDVLPQLRRTGRYETAQQPSAPLAIEQAAVAKAHIEVFGLAMQLGTADESYVRGRVQTILARMIGEEPQLDPTSITITADEYLDGKIGRSSLASARTRLGKAVAALYRARYDRDPQKIERYIDGVHRKVSVYTRRDADLFDAAWAEIGARYIGVTA